jgi:hypothetical protein
MPNDTAPALYVEIDGAPVKLDDAVWIQHAPCGCMCAVSNAERGNDPTLTDDQAWLTFTNTGTKREADLDKAAGFKVRLITLADYRSEKYGTLLGTCPHEPRWGRAVTPIPDGFAWGRDRYNRRAKVRHLVPALALGDFRWKGETFCGQQLPRVTWQADNWMRHETYECARCAAKAEQQAQVSS